MADDDWFPGKIPLPSQLRRGWRWGGMRWVHEGGKGTPRYTIGSVAKHWKFILLVRDQLNEIHRVDVNFNSEPSTKLSSAQASKLTTLFRVRQSRPGISPQLVVTT